MKNLILTALLSLTLWGCITEKKRRFNAEQFYKEHPEELALNCSEKFPVKTSFSKGITIKRIDSTFQKGIVLNCPPVFNSVTGTSYIPKVDCPDVKIIKEQTERVDTIKFENTAKVEAYRLSGEKVKQQLAVSESKGSFLQKKVKQEFFAIIALSVLLLLSVAFHLKRMFSQSTHQGYV